MKILRDIYLYSFSAIGLILLTVGGIRFIDMGLKTYVFKRAYDDIKINYYQPPIAPGLIEKLNQLAIEDSLDKQDVDVIKSFLATYQEWINERKDIDPLRSRREREASINLSLILIGLPLYLYHWIILKKQLINN